MYSVACGHVLYVILHVGASAVGVNPKINNMLDGYNAAKYEILWISDSSVMGECMTIVITLVVYMSCY